MQSLFNYTKRLLSYKWSTPIILCIAVAVKMSLQLTFFNIVGDKSSQLLAAKNFLDGNGLTIKEVLLTDLSSEVFTPLVGWPPGYSVVVAPLLWLFNGDYKSAALVFDLIAVLPFFLFLLLLLNYLSVQKWLKNLMILFVSFFFYPIGPSTCTDLISLSCMLAGFYYFLQLMQGEKKISSLTLVACFFFFMAGLFRYNYIPVVLCTPVLLGIAGYINKNKHWIKFSLYSGLILSVLFVTLLVFQDYYTGSPAYVNTRETGFFPENLLTMYPIVPASFIDVQIVLTVFTNFTGTNYFTNGKILLYSGYLLFLFLIIFVSGWLLNKKLLLKSKGDYFVYLGSGISAVIIGLLFYLSARNSANLSPFFPLWTYIQELRYFIFVVLFIQLCAFAFLFNRFTQLSRFWKKIAVVCAAVILVQFLHKLYYVTKLLTNLKEPHNSSAVFTNEISAIVRNFKTIENQYPGYEIIVASPSNTICNYAGFENIKAAYIPYPFTNTFSFSSTKPAKVILVIPERMSVYYTPKLPSERKAIDKTEKQYFYLLDVIPKKR
ncbi:MAG: hypothetical protein WBO38_00210 [Chitinophagaceae bacterium]